MKIFLLWIKRGFFNGFCVPLEMVYKATQGSNHYNSFKMYCCTCIITEQL